ISYYLACWMLSFLAVRLYFSSRDWSQTQFLIGNLFFALLFALLAKTLAGINAVLLERLFFERETYQWLELYNIWLKSWWDIYQGILYYLIYVAGLVALDIYTRYKNQFSLSLELESKLVRNQLQTLKMQLKPHFLFNALNTIAMMVRRQNNDKAVEMISGLSDMLRSSLSSENRQFVSLEEELALLKKYLAIEEVRYQDRLQIMLDIEPTVLPCKVPNLILQPIVENAFKHSISGSIGDELIKISAKKVQKEVWLDIFNTGSSLPPDWTMVSSKGIGVANTAHRLRQLYQGGFRFQVSDENDGVLVRIILPFQKLDHG
ncbi:MAG: histidine kinase, partial [Bacteroidota bacterium]